MGATYGDTPWADFETNQRAYYVPDLLEIYRHRSLWTNIVDYVVDLSAQRTGQIIFTQPIPPEFNTGTIDVRQLWLPDLYFDTLQIVITTERYGDKMHLHKYDDMITYWRQNRKQGLRNIIRSMMGPHMIGSLDMLARNAFLGADSLQVSFSNGKTGFHDLLATDTFEVGVARAVQLKAGYTPDPINNPVVGIISPSAVYTVRNDNNGEFISRLQYGDPPRLLNYEIGVYEGVLFQQHWSVTLWNVGAILAQTTITAPVQRGDGAPDPNTTQVYGVYKVGQPNATHYVQVADVTGFTVGDRVTLHTARATANDTMSTLDGVVWNHYQNRERMIVSIDALNNRLVFDKPILDDYYSTDLGGGVYGYVTLARPVHAAVFIKGPRAVVAGVTQPPQVYQPAPYDDTEAIYRIAWDAYMKYQMFRPERVEIYFHAGPVPRGNTLVNL